MTQKKMVFVVFLFLGFMTLKAEGHPVIDSFIKANACFFVKEGLPFESIKGFTLTFKDFSPDSVILYRIYRSSYWKNDCKIFNKEKSKRREDLMDFDFLSKIKCDEVKASEPLSEIDVIRLPAIKEGGYTYYYYTLHCGSGYMNVIFKLRCNKIVRFCYELAIS